MVLSRFRPVQRDGMLDRYDDESVEAWLGSLAEEDRDEVAPERRDYWNFRIWTDQDLAEFVSREKQDANTYLAEIEIRRRESWQTPARWSLGVSVLALLVSLGALVITLIS